MVPGSYTDDTQMSLAIAELLLSGRPWTRENLADKFVECFKRDVRLGYSKGFYAFLQSVDDGRDLLERIDPQSSRNGAAMRTAPLGYVKDISRLMSMCELQASITHNTDVGIKSAQAVALASHYMIYELGAKGHVKEFVAEHSKFNWTDSWEGEVTCCGESTVNALFSVLSKSNSLSELLINSVAFTGDVDTVAALDLGIASQCKEYIFDLPEFLYSQLECGQFGFDYLQKVDQLLMGAEF